MRLRDVLLVFMCLLHLPALAAGNPSDVDTQLTWAQRPIAHFRVPYNGADAVGRVARARARLAEFEARDLPPAIEEVAVSVTEDGVVRRGIALRAQDIVLLTLLADDLDPADRHNLTQAAAGVRARLLEALDANRAQRQPEVLLRGILHAMFASLLALLILWLLLRALGKLTVRLRDTHAEADQEAAGASLASYGRTLVVRLAQTAGFAVACALLYAWLTYVLHEFPATQPLSQRLGDLVWESAGKIGVDVAGAIPGLIAVVLIGLFAEGLSRGAQGAFRAVQAGRLSLPGLHRDTAGATRRVVVFVIWALAIVAAYPYIPGSGSGVFQGVSVLIGAMITLGSSGIANQLMSGLTLVYSRALRRGDHVVIGASGSEVEGVVTEIGALATKVTTMRNEEATIPNAVVVANPIRNFSRHADEEGTLVSTHVTIGYDAPWRQVHAMLEEAAGRTKALRTTPSPRVRQRALLDFYVEYWLFANIDQPLDKPVILSQLNANIQDVFNEYGVQIMSPNFVLQPAAAVGVPPEKWYAAPARGPDRTMS